MWFVGMAYVVMMQRIRIFTCLFFSADLSHNKFAELPVELTESFMLECLNCAFNSLKTIPDISHIKSLTYLNIRYVSFLRLLYFALYRALP